MTKKSILTRLEYSVIEKFCEQNGIICPPLENFEVKERDRNPVGFITELRLNDAASAIRCQNNIYNDIPGAVTLKNNIEIGFLLFFVDGFINSIEGFVYGEAWPEIEWPVNYEKFKHSNRFEL